MIIQHKIFQSVYLPLRYITFKFCSYEGCLKGFMKGRKFRFSDSKIPGCWIWEKSTKYQKTANSLELMTVFSCHNGCASFCIIMLSNSKWHFWFFCNFQAKCCLQNKHAEHFLNLMSSAEVNCIAGSVLWWNRGWVASLNSCCTDVSPKLFSSFLQLEQTAAVLCQFIAAQWRMKQNLLALLLFSRADSKTKQKCCAAVPGALLCWNGPRTAATLWGLSTSSGQILQRELSYFSFVSALLREGREGGRKKVLLNSYCCGLLCI